MSIIQDKINELRYIKRKNLEEESKMIGNYLRDIIRSYGVDCHYYKMRTNYPTEFAPIVNQNNLFMHAYGYDQDYDFAVHSDMITYMEVENDIFNLNKYGIIPNTDVNFYFDATDFAASLATQMGKLHEYPIKNVHFKVEFTKDEAEHLTINLPFKSEILSGIVDLPLDEFTIKTGEKHTIICDPILTSKTKLHFPVNPTLYKSFNYTVSSREPDDILILSKFQIYWFPKYGNKILMTTKDLLEMWHKYKGIDVSNTTEYSLRPDQIVTKSNDNFGTDFGDTVTVGEIFKWFNDQGHFEMHGDIFGSVLFHDLDAVAKYKQKIVPNVGDVVTIDFPDERNREQYQITECNDKDLGTNGINPLLHKYIWKCKARRYVQNLGEDIPEHNDANKQLAEKLDLINTAAVDLTKKIEAYENEEDSTYGGYQKPNEFHDINNTDHMHADEIPFDSDHPHAELIDIHMFANESRLVTNGYDLFFVPHTNGEMTLINLTSPTDEIDFTIDPHCDKHMLRFLRATDRALYFVNVEGIVYKLVSDEEIPSHLLPECLDTLKKITTYSNGSENPNKFGDNFYKFTSCNTVLLAVNQHLFCKLGNNKLVRII